MTHSDHFEAQLHTHALCAEEVFGALSSDLQEGLCKWALGMASKTGPVASLTQLDAVEAARVNSARRFGAYTMLARALKQRLVRTPAPQKCVKLISQAFGESSIGFSHKRARA